MVNKRFAELADEEREKNRDRESRRGPLPVANSRFAAAAEMANRERDERGPPPVANSRFAAAAEADRSTYRDELPRGPPPVANSRFAAAAEADRSTYRDDLPRGPPPVANSRFAAAAAMADQEREQEMRDRPGREERGGFNGGFGRDDRGPPPIANSRFAAAVAADEDYVEPERRGFGGDSRARFDDRGGRGGNERFDDRGEGGRGGFDRHAPPSRGGFQDHYDDRGRYSHDDAPAPEVPSTKGSVADLLKPKARPMEENILKIPTKEHAENILKPPTKVHAENVLVPPKKETKAPPAPKAVPEPVVPVVVDDSAVIEEFCSGKRLGDDLKTWLSEQIVPNVKSLLFAFLEDHEKLNPDVSCAWAGADKYGAALVALVEDDLLKQVDVLFAIQKYCDKLGMPKLDGEYVIQAMFRAMYQFDLASDEAFEMWKEDESDENNAGKVNAVIQTVDWFNWLEEDDDEDEEDYEEEE